MSHFCLSSQVNTRERTKWGHGDKKACLLLVLLQWQREPTIRYSSNNSISMSEEFELILMLGQHCWVYRAKKTNKQLHQKSLKHLEIMKVERHPPDSLHCSEATDPEPTSWPCGCPDCPQLVSYSPSKTDCVCVCVWFIMQPFPLHTSEAASSCQAGAS